MTRSYIPAIAAIAVLIAATAALLAPRGSAEAVPDLSGTWNFQITGDFGPPFGQQTLNCTTEFIQTGNDIDADFQCGIGSGVGTATLTPQSVGADIDVDLDLDVSGIGAVDAHAVGTVAPDGNSMEGTWTSETFDTEGTFEAERDVFQYIHGDLNCDGNIDGIDALIALNFHLGLPFDQYPGCPAVAAQLAAVHFGDVNCDTTVGPPDAINILRHRGGLPIPVPSSTACPNIGDFIFAD